MRVQILGININSETIELAEIDCPKDEITVLKAGSMPRRAALKDESEALISFLKSNQIKTRRAVISLSPAEAVYLLVELPILSDAEVDKAVQYKITPSLPYLLKDAIIAFYKLEMQAVGDKQLYFVAAIPEKLVTYAINLAKSVKLLVLDIIPASASLNNITRAVESPAFAIVNIEEHHLLISLVKRGQVVFSHDVKVIGGGSITRALIGVVTVPGAEKLEIDQTKAEEIIKNYGIPIDYDSYSKASNLPASEVQAMMRPALEKMGAEIMRTFEFYGRLSGDQTEFKQIYFSGAVAKTANLAEYYKDLLQRDVLTLDLKTDPSCALALGAAMSGKNQPSFLNQEKRKELAGRFNWFFSTWVVTFFYLTAMILIYTAFFSLKNKQEIQLKYYQDQLSAKGAAITKEPSKSETVARKLFDDYKMTDCFFPFIKQLETITPGSVYFESLDYKRRTNELVIKGVVMNSEKAEGAGEFVQRLNNSHFFKSVDLVSLVESNRFTTPVFDFEIKCVVAEIQKK